MLLGKSSAILLFYLKPESTVILIGIFIELSCHSNKLLNYNYFKGLRRIRQGNVFTLLVCSYGWLRGPVQCTNTTVQSPPPPYEDPSWMYYGLFWTILHRSDWDTPPPQKKKKFTGKLDKFEGVRLYGSFTLPDLDSDSEGFPFGYNCNMLNIHIAQIQTRNLIPKWLHSESESEPESSNVNQPLDRAPNRNELFLLYLVVSTSVINSRKNTEQIDSFTLPIWKLLQGLTHSFPISL